MPLNDFNPRDFGLVQDYLYEVLATTFPRGEQDKPNTSCMGIRLIENNLIQIRPFPETTTLKNLKETGIIVLNFVEDVYLYALAALKSRDTSIKFPSKYYNYLEIENPFDQNSSFSTINIPYIKKAWAILTCIIATEEEKIKKDIFEDIKLTEFKLHVISSIKSRDSFKLYNRAENLSLETIIFTTRLKIAKEKNDITLLKMFYGKIRENIENIERFGRNKRALKAIEVVLEFIKFLC